jgi:hypothetical protein
MDSNFGHQTLDGSAGRGHNLWRICRPLCQTLFLSELGFRLPWGREIQECTEVRWVNRRVFAVPVLLVCLLATRASFWGQNTAAPSGVPGYLNPRTGVVHSIRHHRLLGAAAPPATTTYSGTIVVNFTITVSSAIARTAQIGCVASASVVDAGTDNGIVEGAGAAVTRGTGSTVTCSVTIPYSWNLASANLDTVALAYSVTSSVDFSAPAGEWPHRAGAQSLGSIGVPVSGTNTTKTVSVRI